MSQVVKTLRLLPLFFIMLILWSCQENKEFSIIFDTNGGNNLETITQEYNSSITLPTPEKVGHTFDGWFKESDLKNLFNKTTMPNKNITLYAKWTVNTYTISFNTKDGSIIAPITQNYGTNVSAPDNPTKAGYKFTGWYLDNELTKSYSFTTMPSENITLYAKWSINAYTITFESDGGTLLDPITNEFETPITIPKPTKTGYTFVGWYLDENLTIPNNLNKIPEKNTTLYAKWSVNQYTITFESFGGSTVNPITQDYNTTLSQPQSPTYDGYTFGGWFIDQNYTQSYSFITMPSESITLFAKWNPNKYTISFNSMGGSPVDSITDYYLELVMKPTDPTKTGFTFGGWFIDENYAQPYTFSTMPKVSIELFAKWINTDSTYSEDLLISEYFEGSSGNNKYIELYNNTGVKIDLSKYTLANYPNGKVTAGSKLNLYGTLEHGKTLIVYNSFSEISEILDSRGIGTTNVITFNGDDAIALLKNNQIIDVFGIIGRNEIFKIDNVSVADKTVIRNKEVLNPSNTFDEEEWTILGTNNTSNLGIHTIDSSNTGPTDPNEPLEEVDKETLRKTINETMQDAVIEYYDASGYTDYFYLLPSTDDVNILVIPIEFPDDKFTPAELDMIEYGFFGDGNQFETLKSYYSESSYGALNISGEVLNPLTASKNYQYYETYYSNNNEYASGVDLLIEEAIRYYLTNNPDLDLSIYDREGDGYLDGVHLVYSAPIEYDDEDTIFWAFQYYYNATSGEDDSDYVSWGEYEFDSYVFSSVDFFYENDTENAWTIIHETGHLMGLEDYYDYNSEDSYNNQGGLGGADMMDYTNGDHNPFSKLLLDWIDPIVVEESLIITISEFSTSGDAIIISDEFTSIFDEYFILSYYTPTGLNEGNNYFTESGLIMYHVNAELPYNYNYMYDYSYFLENNNSDSPQKLIKIEEADGDNSISNHGSDAENSDLLQEGDSYTFRLYNGKNLCTITVLEMTSDGIKLSIRF